MQGSAAADTRRAELQVSGGYIGGVLPVPIPNTAVKPSRADGTARPACGRVGRCRNFSPRRPAAHPSRGASPFQPKNFHRERGRKMGAREKCLFKKRILPRCFSPPALPVKV